MSDKKILLIDGHSILNRAFYALPPTMTDSEGHHTNAVFGFLNMMFRFIDSEKPDFLGVAFDMSEPTFRHKMFAEYKGTRHPMPPELKEQVPMIQEMLHAMGIPIYTKAGYEADDILGTLSRQAEAEGLMVSIMSGDRDLLQLATERTAIIIPSTKKTGTEVEKYFESDVIEKKGVTPTEFIDVKALMGDKSDNIPGVPSIGEVTATRIIKEYHSLENAIDHVDELKPPKAAKKLDEFRDQAFFSKTLATIVLDAPVKIEFTGMDIYRPEALSLCRKWQFRNLIPRFSETDEKNTADKWPDNHVEELSLDDFLNEMGNFDGSDFYGVSFIILKKKLLAAAFCRDEKTFCLSLSDKSDDDRNHAGRLIWDLILKKADGGVRFSFDDIKEALSILDFPCGEKISVSKYGYKSYFDASVASYLIDPLNNSYSCDRMASAYLGLTIPSREELFLKKKDDEIIREAPDLKDDLINIAGERAFALSKLPDKLSERLQDMEMKDLYDRIELPLVFTLSDMEKYGMSIDTGELEQYGKLLDKTILETEKRIYEAAGLEFNINSPKQLGEVLFNKMGLPNAKKTKTGYSTSAEVLEGMSDIPVINDILTYRQYKKIRSTYVDGLGSAVSPDGKIHSTFQQKVTATGRISSAEPNLQNIPVRVDIGKKIRKVFHPETGFVYLDADYSQIELRVLAHMSGDPNLIEAYREGKDIHRSTASLVFKKPFDEVTENERRSAKAVNFGIVYGISAFGLAKDLHISRAEAAAYIENYYKAYPNLKSYLDSLVTSAKEKGYAVTLFKRRRPVPELSSSNFMTRQFGERVAKNSPIQGTAADIIKIAMVRVHDRLIKEGFKSRLVLQVHDELLIEAYKDELDLVSDILKEEMENAAHLKVALTVDMETGDTWYDAK